MTAMTSVSQPNGSSSTATETTPNKRRSYPKRVWLLGGVAIGIVSASVVGAEIMDHQDAQSRDRAAASAELTRAHDAAAAEIEHDRVHGLRLMPLILIIGHNALRTESPQPANSKLVGDSATPAAIAVGQYDVVINPVQNSQGAYRYATSCAGPTTTKFVSSATIAEHTMWVTPSSATRQESYNTKDIGVQHYADNGIMIDGQKQQADCAIHVSDTQVLKLILQLAEQTSK